MKLAPFLSWYHGPVRRWCRAAGTPGPAVQAAAIAVLLFIWGCSESGAALAPVASPRPSRMQRWDRFDEVRTWPRVASTVPSDHGVGELQMDVRVAAPYRAAYVGLVAGQRWPVGMAVAVFHEHRGSREPGSIYAMTKSADDAWEYVVSRADGTLEARGALPLCVRCHGEARADSLFGLPSGVTESTTPALRSSSNPSAR